MRSWLGAIIGTAFRWTAEAVVLPLVIRPVDPACKWTSLLPVNHGYQIASVRFRQILLKKSAARAVLRCAAAALLAGGLVSVGRSEVGASLFRG